MSFEPITTQEDFDKAISERLKREKETYEKRFSDYETLKGKAGKYDEIAGKDYEAQLKELTEKLAQATETLAENKNTVAEITTRAEAAEAKLLKGRIAHESGIPFELAEKLSGTTEKELREDAKVLAEFVAGKKQAPLKSTEDPTGDSKQVALKSVLEKLTTQ